MRGEFVRENVPDWPTYADREGLTLVGRAKGNRFLVVSGGERVIFDDGSPTLKSGLFTCVQVTPVVLSVTTPV